MVETLPFFAKVCKVICVLLLSRPARGAWIEIPPPCPSLPPGRSRPARGAWIEIGKRKHAIDTISVAPREGRVD